MTTPASPAPSAGAPPTVADALNAAAATCALAAAGYQLLGPRLADPALADQARADEQAQRDARTAALQRMAALAVTATGAGAELALPARVADDQSARQLATQLEDAAAASWRVLLSAALDPAASDPQPTRMLALAQLQGAAVRAGRWRIAAGAAASDPFPGLTT